MKGTGLAVRTADLVLFCFCAMALNASIKGEGDEKSR